MNVAVIPACFKREFSATELWIPDKSRRVGDENDILQQTRMSYKFVGRNAPHRHSYFFFFEMRAGALADTFFFTRTFLLGVFLADFAGGCGRKNFDQ